MPEPFYVTTPIYYVNDVPHIGHAYTTVVGRRAGPLAPALGRRRRVPHRHRRARPEGPAGGRGPGRQPAGVGRPRRARASARPWDDLDITNDDFIRTTEPRHTRAVQEFLQRVYDNGDIELDTYEGLYCVGCELYYTEDELDRRPTLPDPRHGRSSTSPRRTTSSGSRATRTACSSTTPSTPRPCSRPGSATRCSGSSSRGCSTSRSAARRSRGASRCRGTPRTSPTCGSTRSSTTAPRSATADDRARFDRYWPVDYHLIGKDILRQHAVYWPAMLMAAGEAPPKTVFAHGYLLVGGEKMSKTQPQPDRARRPRRRVRRRRLPLPLPRRPALRSRRRLQLRGDGGALQRRPRQQLRQPGQPGAQHGGELLRRGGARHARRRAAGRGRRHRLRRAHRAARASSTTPVASARCGTSSARRTRTSRSSSRGRSTRPATRRAVAAVLGDCLEALRIVALLASPLIPRAAAELWRRLGLPGAPEDQRLPEAAGWGGLAAGIAAGEGRAAVPPDRHRVVTAGAPHRRWVDSHCHLGWEASGGRPRHHGGAGPGRRGSRRWCAWGPTWRRRGGRSSSPTGTPTCGRPSACTPTTRPGSTRSGTRWSTLARDRADVVVGIGEAGFDFYYEHSAAAAQEAAFRAQIAARPRPRPRAGDPLARRVGRHLPRPRRRGRAAPHRVPLLHRRPR